VNQQKKAQIKAEMERFLKVNGWPDRTKDPDRLVMNLVEPMFNHLVKCGLVPTQAWEQYYSAAISQYERAQLRKAGFPV
jgi:hypothetical protein